jgi:ribosome-binding protein aMBF1 (putative translation factor)
VQGLFKRARHSKLEKLGKIVSDKQSTWQEEAKWREQNEEWLSVSFEIAIKVLDALKSKGMTQKMLADEMQVTPQFVNKIVKGQENLSLETIGKLSKALCIKLIEVVSEEIEEPVYDFDQAYEVSEQFRKQVFAKASQHGYSGLIDIQVFRTQEERQYKLQA